MTDDHPLATITPSNGDGAREPVPIIRTPDGPNDGYPAGQSYFRDLFIVATREARLREVMNTPGALLASRGRDPGAEPGVLDLVAGGIEGAVGRLSSAAEESRRAILEKRANLRIAARKAGVEERAMSTAVGSGIGFIPLGPPVTIADMFADAVHATSPLAGALLQGELPPTGTVVSVPRFSTGAATAVQSAEAAAINDSSAVSLLATANVVTVSGKVDLSLQLLERSLPRADEAIATSLAADFAKQLDAQLINGSGAAGQAVGLLTVTPGTTDTWTDASPTPAKNFGKVMQLCADVAAAFGRAPDALVMHPRRAWWIHTLTDLSGTPPDYRGVRVIESANVPTNLGAGTNQDAVIALRLAESPVFVSQPSITIETEVLSGNLQARAVVHSYLAFVSNRQPASIGTLTGTGLTAPVFV